MNKRGHWILGALLSLLFILVVDSIGIGWFGFDFLSILTMIAIILFYSILPDMDHKNSTITWWFFSVGVIGLIVSIIQLIFSLGNPLSMLIMSTVFIVVTFISARIIPHRGFIHTIQIGILSVIPLWFIFHNFGYVLLGYVAWHSHLMGDGYFWKVK
jgi:phosphoglycerol transferase MdoB-like AlkP superfamily enzyme